MASGHFLVCDFISVMESIIKMFYSTISTTTFCHYFTILHCPFSPFVFINI